MKEDGLENELVVPLFRYFSTVVENSWHIRTSASLMQHHCGFVILNVIIGVCAFIMLIQMWHFEFRYEEEVLLLTKENHFSHDSLARRG